MDDIKNTFDFLISNEDEVMLILNARDTNPRDPAVRLRPEEHIVELYRSPQEPYTLQNVDADVFRLLKEEDNLLICEISPTDNPDETEIVYAYEAPIIE